MARRVIVAALCIIAISAFSSSQAGMNPNVKSTMHILQHGLHSCTKNLPVLNSCSDAVTNFNVVQDVDVFVAFYDFEGILAAEFGLDWPAEWGTGSMHMCSDLCVGVITSPGDGTLLAWNECEPWSGRPLLPFWEWLSPTGPGLITLLPNPVTGYKRVIDCADIPDRAADTLTYSARGGVLTGGDPPCGPGDHRCTIDGGPQAARGQIGVPVLISGANSSNLKGFSVCIKFDPGVFSVNPAVVDTVATAAAGSYTITVGSSDSTAQAGVVFSYECPPSIPPGFRPPDPSFIKFLLDVKPTAPLGSTVIEIADVGLSKNRMTACDGFTIQPVYINGTVEIVAEQFIRGDDDGDGELTISDPILSLCAQFGTSCELSCLDASDVDDDGGITISDPIYNLNAQFGYGQLPPAPFPGCGPDPTGDALDCTCYEQCMGCPAGLEASGRQLVQAEAADLWAGAPAGITVPVGVKVTGISLTAVPNPTKGASSVRYGVPLSAAVEIKVYNTSGQVVRTLVDQDQVVGRYEVLWDGRSDSGRAVPDGVYFCRASVGGSCETLKLAVLR